MSDSVRRGHLIFSSGVGGLTILRNGTSVICASLDFWFRDDHGNENEAAIDKSKVSDWRLEARVRVDELRTPPAAPEHRPRWVEQEPTVGVPFLLFPLWHVCTNPACRRLTLERNNSNLKQRRCEACAGGKTPWSPKVQVPLVAACEDGHLEEFPWQGWLTSCHCDEPILKLRQSGGSGLANFRLSCDKCGAGRSMSGALVESGLQQCGGGRPWMGHKVELTACGKKLKGVLRNSASIYYSNVVSSVFIPRADTSTPETLRELIKGNPYLRVLLDTGMPLEEVAVSIRAAAPHAYQPFTVEQIMAALDSSKSISTATSLVPDELDYRQAEFRVLQQEITEEQRQEGRLAVRPLPITEYSLPADCGLESISLVDSLTVTKVLTGFARLVPGGSWDAHQSETQLWRWPSEIVGGKWLPAIQVRGEGVFLRFDERKLSAWENRADVIARVERLAAEASMSRYVPKRLGLVGSRFVLLHPVSHLLMSQMVFEAGYSATSLSERIYSRVPSDDAPPMAGILMYTASGDAEGSLGGLVRLGKPSLFEDILLSAIDSARWCSSDPICMELGGSQGQGPDGLNLAACHSCAHVPETACESFNVLLDRALVVGSLDNPALGFFNSLLS